MDKPAILLTEMPEWAHQPSNVTLRVTHPFDSTRSPNPHGRSNHEISRISYALTPADRLAPPVLESPYTERILVDQGQSCRAGTQNHT